MDDYARRSAADSVLEVLLTIFEWILIVFLICCLILLALAVLVLVRAGIEQCYGWVKSCRAGKTGGHRTRVADGDGRKCEHFVDTHCE